MRNPSARIILYSSLAIVLLVFMWGLREIPAEGHIADQALRESLNQELIVLGGAVKASTQAMKYRLLDVLKAEGNEHSPTRSFQDSPFLAATLLEWDQVQWKSLWYSTKSKTDMQASELKNWLQNWPLSKLSSDEVYFTKVGDVQGQAYFAILVPVRKPNQIPMIGVGIFPAAQFGLNFSADESREVRVFTETGMALALSHPAYLGASLRTEPLIHDMIEGEEVTLRQEWKSERGTSMIGVASKINDSNLYIALETKSQVGTRAAAWAYLILCALGAGIINWVLFNSVFRTLVTQITSVEKSNENLRKQISETPRVPVTVIPDPILTADELATVDFIEAQPTAPVDEEVPAESDETPVAPVENSMARVVHAAVSALDKRLNDAKIAVMHFGLDDLELPGDALQVQTAIEEVLKNAIEAMTNANTRNLTVSGRKTPTGARLTIEDTGCGIPTANVAKVFDPFYSTKDSEGVARGLGLNVVRRVIEELEGTVKVNSQEGKGTRVEIEWPIAAKEVSASDLDFLEADVPEVEEFAVAGDMPPPVPQAKGPELPTTMPSEREWPEIEIRKPRVRTLD